MRVVSIFILSAILPRWHALNAVASPCRKCESEFCMVPPFLRYCGILYIGCPGEKPCDGLDACCMKHDSCVQSKQDDYLSQDCSRNLLNCMAKFKKAGGQTFKGNKCNAGEVIDVISVVMEAALVAGRSIHRR